MKSSLIAQAPPQKRVVSSSFYLFVQGFSVNIVGIIYYLLATKILSVSEIGIANALSLIASLFSVFGTLAIPAAAMKYIAEFWNREGGAISKGIYRKVLVFSLLASGFVSLLCFIASSVISKVFLGSGSYDLLIRLLAFDVFAIVFISFCGGILAGLQKFREISLATIFYISLKYAISFFFISIGFGLTGLVIGWIVGDFVAVVTLLYLAYVPFRGIKESRPYSFISLTRYSAPLYVAGILGYFSGTIDKYVILFFGGLQVFAIYSIAMTTAGVIGIITSSLSGPLTPQYSEIYSKHGKQALIEASVKTSRYVFLIVMPLAMGLAATAFPTITLFFGVAYGSGWLPLAMVSSVNALTCGIIVINNLLLSLAATRAFLESQVLAMIVGAPLLALLVGPFESVGAAFAKSIMVTVMFMYSAYVLRGHLGLHFDLNAFKKVLVSSAVMTIVVVLIQFFVISTNLLLLQIFVGAIVYFSMLRVLKLIEAQDIMLMSQTVPKRLNRVVDLFAWLYGVRKEAYFSRK